MRIFTTEWRNKLSESAKKRFEEGRNKNLLMGSPTGEKNPNWKKDNVSYMHLHRWLRKNFVKKGVCEKCGKIGKTDWANISGKYKRDRSDFEEICRSCHSKNDKRIKNIHRMIPHIF